MPEVRARFHCRHQHRTEVERRYARARTTQLQVLFLGQSSSARCCCSALYTMFMLWWSYSEGERAGVLQKFSKRGWICKTYEGELALYVVGGIAPQIWHFSVRDPAVAEQLHKAVGQQLRVHYTEHPGLPTTCFGETDYFADRFERHVGRRPPSSRPGTACAERDVQGSGVHLDPGRVLIRIRCASPRSGALGRSPCRTAGRRRWRSTHPALRSRPSWPPCRVATTLRARSSLTRLLLRRYLQHHTVAAMRRDDVKAGTDVTVFRGLHAPVDHASRG